MDMLIAWDGSGHVIATLDHLVVHDDDGNALGLVDFEAHRASDGSLTDIWKVKNAAGSDTWPEWLGRGAHGFRVQRGAGGRVTALVHQQSGHRRERAAIEAAINERINEARARAVAAGRDPAKEPADIRDLVGGPDHPLLLDTEGRTKPRVKRERPNLPLIAAKGR